MTLRELWQTDRPTIGGWCSIPSAFSAELMGRFGFDWVCIDTQHGLIGYEQMTGMLEALNITRTPALVRVPWNSPDNIMKALDAGAHGVIVPMISTADDARAAVGAVKYPPLGTRSWGPIRASLDFPGYSAETANAETAAIVMIETREGVENLEEILSVPGVDAVYVGPMDLALAHGIEPTLNVVNDEHLALIEKILEACQRHGIVAGIHCDGINTIGRWWDLGYRMCTLASDAALLRAAATEALTAADSHPLRGGVARVPEQTTTAGYA
ncbi:HpcH/HpaI aldolase/citrate lyase family protein [Gryllotalpicola reticulitermitis]|uniref:HpcH/HpaI aldolase/citrate lyase family protein n=1 Tax=Gryllotalpicola reticulitermitis TaxID=1184153 RepID=A0ABV8Q0M6_9MICO